MLPVHGGWNFLRGVSLLCFVAALPAQAEIVVDGRIDESEWENAIRCEDWRRTVPFARDECGAAFESKIHVLCPLGAVTVPARLL
jgi:hypothetical protein